MSTIFLVDTMNTSALTTLPPRTRRNHTPEFKAQVIAACLQTGASVAAVALANQLNANYLRSLVKEYRKQQQGRLPATLQGNSATCPAPTLIPVTVQKEVTQPCGGIQIEIRRQGTVFQITWPTSEATACTQWLREVLR